MGSHGGGGTPYSSQDPYDFRITAHRALIIKYAKLGFTGHRWTGHGVEPAAAAFVRPSAEDKAAAAEANREWRKLVLKSPPETDPAMMGYNFDLYDVNLANGETDGVNVTEGTLRCMHPALRARHQALARRRDQRWRTIISDWQARAAEQEAAEERRRNIYERPPTPPRSQPRSQPRPPAYPPPAELFDPALNTNLEEEAIDLFEEFNPDSLPHRRPPPAPPPDPPPPDASLPRTRQMGARRFRW